jgi:hypothetical protein
MMAGLPVTPNLFGLMDFHHPPEKCISMVHETTMSMFILFHGILFTGILEVLMHFHSLLEAFFCSNDDDHR